MANKAAIDFGNSNTVAAVWNDEAQRAEILRIPGLSDADSFAIPSLVTYEPDGRYFIGGQNALHPEEKEFRWMKRYIGLRSPYSLRIGDKRIDAKQAAEDFLRLLTASVISETGEDIDELILSVPVESFEHYSDWLLKEMRRFENTRLRLIDEAAAAAAGYGLSLHPGDTLLILDFGGSTLQAVCVAVSEEGEVKGKCCRVLGKSGCSIGGMTLDRWIFSFILARLGLSESDPEVLRNSAALLRYCEAVKKSLTVQESITFDFFPDRLFLMTREDMEQVFRKNGLFGVVDEILSNAIRNAEDHGFSLDTLTAVVPVGGSSFIPAVHQYLESRFTPEKVLYGEPLGAVARGAAVIAGGMHIYDFIQHSYAIRYTDSQSGSYAFRTIIPRGTKYPEKQVTGVMKIKAAFDGQNRFGISIYEMQETLGGSVNQNEVFFDAEGRVHVLPLTEKEIKTEQQFWINEQNPLFLNTETPTVRGTAYFAVSFGIDANKMLTITAVDLTTDALVMADVPLLRLV